MSVVQVPKTLPNNDVQEMMKELRNYQEAGNYITAYLIGPRGEQFVYYSREFHGLTDHMLKISDSFRMFEGRMPVDYYEEFILGIIVPAALRFKDRNYASGYELNEFRLLIKATIGGDIRFEYNLQDTREMITGKNKLVEPIQVPFDIDTGTWNHITKRMGSKAKDYVSIGFYVDGQHYIMQDWNHFRATTQTNEATRVWRKSHPNWVDFMQDWVTPRVHEFVAGLNRGGHKGPQSIRMNLGVCGTNAIISTFELSLPGSRIDVGDVAAMVDLRQAVGLNTGVDHGYVLAYYIHQDGSRHILGQAGMIDMTGTDASTHPKALVFNTECSRWAEHLDGIRNSCLNHAVSRCQTYRLQNIRICFIDAITSAGVPGCPDIIIDTNAKKAMPKPDDYVKADSNEGAKELLLGQIIEQMNEQKGKELRKLAYGQGLVVHVTYKAGAPMPTSDILLYLSDKLRENGWFMHFDPEPSETRPLVFMLYPISK
uniref:Uncharacterized protein n=1 Tax=Pseudomonas phage RVTF4 TaxID=3236931 RepID=A0AB39CD34_9VIRU